MLSLRIAARFLKTSPAQTGLIIAGIAVGIAVQIFVGSLITSLQANLVQQTIGNSPQVTISAIKDGDPVVYSQRIRQVIAADSRVKPGAVVAVRTANGLYSNGDQSSPLSLIGGDLAGLDGIYGIKSRTTSGAPSLATGEIMVGTDFAKKYSLSPGSTVGLSFSGGQSAQLKISGIFDLGSSAFNERQAFVNADLPRNLLGWSANQYSQVQVQLAKPFDSKSVASWWQSQLPGVSVTEWQSANADLLTALQSQSSSSYMIQVFVLVAVALGIASTLAISAVQKTRQIGILKAMGMGDRRAGRIFLWQAAILGVAGSLAGLGLGWGLIASFGLAPVPFSIKIQPTFAAISAGVGIAVALVSSIIPTRRTSRLDPIEVIQSG